MRGSLQNKRSHLKNIDSLEKYCPEIRGRGLFKIAHRLKNLTGRKNNGSGDILRIAIDDVGLGKSHDACDLKNPMVSDFEQFLST
jgi:hypothetical protein